MKFPISSLVTHRGGKVDKAKRRMSDLNGEYRTADSYGRAKMINLVNEYGLPDIILAWDMDTPLSSATHRLPVDHYHIMPMTEL